MIWKLSLPVVCLIACTLSAQTSQTSSLQSWEPSLLIKPSDHLPKGTKPKALIRRLQVADENVALQETNLSKLADHFGAETGGRGDAGDTLAWACFQGISEGRRWMLWLMSGEMDAGSIGGFQWRMVPGAAKINQHCRSLPKGAIGIKLPVAIQVGMTKTALLQILGQPTITRKGRLLYVHDKEVSVKGEPYTQMNLVGVIVRNEVVYAIEIWESTFS